MNQSIACLCPKFREKYGINKGSVIGYGIGLYYHQIKNLYTDLCLDYVMDIKWRNDPPQEYEGVPVITEDDLLKIKDPIILAFPRSASILCEVRSSFGARARVFDAAEAYGSEKLISGSEINRTATHGEIRDDRGNLIVCEGNVPDQLCIKFYGKNNTVTIGQSITARDLKIIMGTEGAVRIGDGATFEKAVIQASFADINIGRDCMVSTDVFIRSHDLHHIFDLKTGKRINCAESVTIGEHVWIGRGVSLLGGACIGNGSVIGEKAVTSSVFGENLIIAGNPARVIREDIVWDRESTYYFDRHNLSECSDI